MKRLGLLFLLLGGNALAGDAIDPRKLKDSITIAIGEKCEVQFEEKGDALLKPVKVTTPDAAKPLISLNFKNERDMPLLVIRNAFPRTLEFRAAMKLKGRKDYIETSILPVGSNMSNYESWSDPIEELVLFDFKLTNETFN